MGITPELDPLVQEHAAGEERLRRVLQLDEDTLQGAEIAGALRQMRAAVEGAVREAERLADLLLDSLRELEDMDTDRRLTSPDG